MLVVYRPTVVELGREPWSAQRQESCFLFHMTVSQLNEVAGEWGSAAQGDVSPRPSPHRARGSCMKGYGVWDGGSLGGGEEGGWERGGVGVGGLQGGAVRSRENVPGREKGKVQGKHLAKAGTEWEKMEVRRLYSLFSIHEMRLSDPSFTLWGQ